MALPTQLPESWQRAAAALAQRHGHRLPVLAAAVLAILLGRVVADLVWLLVPMPDTARWRPPPAATATARPADATDVGAIAGSGLFGRYQAPASGAVLSAPDTPLNLALLGVLADDREQYSRALIAQGADERSFAVGDDVSAGVTLQAIFPDRVILSRNGRLETLRLERDQPGAGGEGASSPLAQADERGPGAPPPLAQVRDELLKDPARASDYVRIQPAQVGGQLKGYRVYPGRDRAAFTAAGLRPGDLVTSVNGVQLDDPARALQMLGDLASAGQVNLVVERGGQTQNISINLSQ